MIEPSAYGRVDRLLHRVALDSRFGGTVLQKSLAEIEGGLIDDRDAPARPPAPVFVTALPRAGTTLLLNLLAAVPEFATHTYRDMPFVLAPLLWSRLAAPFRRTGEMRERAHGDGVAVGYDSPEAFEEVLWMSFWSRKYRSDTIEPWRADDRDPVFEAFFARHMRTVIAARARERTGPAPTRYLSKNNANIARLSLLADLFPDCRILVPLREPLSHCRSLARQHRRFVKLHAGEPFARQYMSWIGHFEFGADLRPIDFGDAGRDGYANDPLRLDFWLRYWISAQKAILRAGHGVIRLDYGMLRAEPAQSLRALAEALEVGDAGALMRQAHRVHPPIDDIANNDDATADDPSLLCRATELYDESRHQCINPNVA